MDIDKAKKLAAERPSGLEAKFDTNSGVATPGAGEAGDTKSKTAGAPAVGESDIWLPS